MLFPADVGTPSIDRHSGQRHARNVAKWPGEGGYTESTTGEVQWPSAPYDGSGNHRPPPLDTAGQSVDVTGGWASFMAGFPVPWCMCRNAGWEHDGGTRSLTRRQVQEIHRPPHQMRPGDQPTSQCSFLFAIEAE